MYPYMYLSTYIKHLGIDRKVNLKTWFLFMHCYVSYFCASFINGQSNRINLFVRRLTVIG